MRFTSFAAVAAFTAVAVAAPTNVERHVLHEKRNVDSKNWVKRSRIHQDEILPMRFGLVQSNLDKGHDILMDISNPYSENFAKHWSAEEVNDLFAPSQSAVDAVRGWLEKAGVEAHKISQSVNKQWIQLDLKASEAEALLQTNYHFFEHTPTGKVTIGCDKYHVHEEVKRHIDYITPGVKLLASRKPEPGELERRSFGWGKTGTTPPLLAALPASMQDVLSQIESGVLGLLDGILDPVLLGLCDVAITPPCIRAMYNFTKATSAVPGNQLGIFEDLGDYYAQTDLNEFFATLAPEIPIGTHPTLEGIDGAMAPTNVLNAGAESDLDFQISYPIIYPQNSILFQTDDPVYEANYTFAGFLNNFLDAIDGSYCTAADPTGSTKLDPPYPDPQPGGYKGQLQCGVYKPTNVVSVSYGGQEYDLPSSYQTRQCQEYMKLGMQGVSFLISSGDSGVAGPAGDDSANGCLNSTQGGPGYIFSPDFPVTCPYVTAVGATLLTGSAKQDQETAVTRFGSGGGFSNIYDIPTYQKAAVNTYLTQHTPPYPSYTDFNNPGNGRYRRTGRAYPDVSAVGDNVVIFNKGAPTLIGGTSASAPAFAGIVTRINDERIKAGKKPVGFLNPTLYANPSALHDITVGNNPGCNTTGFAVAKGWDPVTGLGTPNYPALLKVFMALP